MPEDDTCHFETPMLPTQNWYIQRINGERGGTKWGEWDVQLKTMGLEGSLLRTFIRPPITIEDMTEKCLQVSLHWEQWR
jgi:hypothetical protein